MGTWPTREELVAKIGEEFASRRAASLERLKPAVKIAEALAPLPISYDVTKIQPPFFFEFTWTEMMGGLYVSPQSAEISARLCRQAARIPLEGSFHLAAADKYAMQPAARSPRLVAFLPGSNIARKALDFNALTRAMDDEPELVVKPHPMTDPGLLREFRRAFGEHRMIDKDESGCDLLAGCVAAYVCSTTELGLYAVLAGKRIANIGNVRTEAQGAYNSFYAQVWKDPTSLRRMLASGRSGWFDPRDPELERKMRAYFDVAMRLRERFRPLVREISPTDYADFLAGRFIRKEAA